MRKRIFAAFVLLACLTVQAGIPYVVDLNGRGTNTLFFGGVQTNAVADMRLVLLVDPVTGTTSLDWKGRQVLNSLGASLMHWRNSTIEGNGSGLSNAVAATLSGSVSNWVLNLIGDVNQNFYFTSVTQTFGVIVSTNCFTMIDLPVAAAATNSIAVPTAGVYFLSRVSTNTITRLENGPIALQTFIYISGGVLVQTITAHPEMWLWYTNDSMELIATSGPQVFTEGSSPTIFQTSMSVTASTNLPAGTRLLLRWYADAVANSPTWNFVIGGNYDSHISVNVAHLSGTYEGTFIGDGSQLTGIPQTNTLGISLDGGGSAITTGVKGYIEVPWNCTIQQSTLMADQVGSIGINIWRTNSTGFPPTSTTLLSAAATPSLNATNWGRDTTLTGWITALTAGDFLGFNVESNSTITRCTLQIKVTR